MTSSESEPIGDNGPYEYVQARDFSLFCAPRFSVPEAIRMQGNDVNIFVAESDFLESSFFRFNRSHFSSNLSQNFVMDKEHKSARHLFEQ